jgi:hypothetical protein
VPFSAYDANAKRDRYPDTRQIELADAS